jgi:hypothetical protein
MTEIEIRALEIARDEFELKLRAAEKRAAAVAEERRKRERQSRFRDREDNRKAALLEIPCDIWVPALTGVEIPNGRRMSCPLPDHESDSPSCRFYDLGFYCWACGRGGHVFVFAEHLWGIPRIGPRFPEILDRLAELLL